MIYDAVTLVEQHVQAVTLKADLCVIGAGAGGSAAAMVAAEAGMSVIVLEAGEFLTPADMTQREEEMLPQLLWAAGSRTTDDKAVKIHQGRGVGGSTLHNLNLCKRIPKPIREAWRRQHGLQHLPPELWDALYDEVEALLQVSAVAREHWNPHNRLLEKACDNLGWKGAGLSHNRTGCLGSGFCELGCAYDAKNNASKVLLPRIVQAGGQVITRCQAIRANRRGAAMFEVEAVARAASHVDPCGRLTVKAPAVCVAASATATPAFLQRSQVADPYEVIGRTLRLHPAVMAAGDFAEPVQAWKGIPQTYECTERLNFEGDGDRLWIVPAFAHPMATATMIPASGAEHREVMQRYAHLGVFTAMLHDHTAGRVRAKGDLDLRIDYWPSDDDRRQLARGISACVQLLFAAGAQRVFVPTASPRFIQPGEPLSDLDAMEIKPGSIDITAVHPMGSAPMSDDPQGGAVDSRGACHQQPGLWVADGSLFPTSIGVPPQLSIYAMGLHVGRNVVSTT